MHNKIIKKVFHKIGFEWLIFLLLLSISLYLRFYGIQETVSFGWDQGRDAWVARDIVQGKFSLVGPRTGIGHFHLGPVYYYLLAPFYFFANLDPMASNYFNILANIINFIILFVVAKKIFNNRTALFIMIIWTTSYYLSGSRIPWNVTLMPGIAALIFYSIYKVYQGKYSWVFIAWALSGFYINLHFTAIFLPPILLASFIFVKEKIKVLKYTLFSIPLYFIWFIPNVIHELQNHSSDLYKIKDFINDYYIGFHFRFMLHRLPDAFIQFSAIINYPPFSYMKYIIPAVFLIVAFLSGQKKDRLFAYLISLWFIIPLILFTLYGGPLSDYYFLSSAPIVLFTIGYLENKLYLLKSLPLYLLLIIFTIIYVFLNTKDSWIKPTEGGLTAQKNSAREKILQGTKIQFNEGDIESYLYTIWVEDGKRF